MSLHKRMGKQFGGPSAQDPLSCASGPLEASVCRAEWVSRTEFAFCVETEDKAVCCSWGLAKMGKVGTMLEASAFL